MQDGTVAAFGLLGPTWSRIIGIGWLCRCSQSQTRLEMPEGPMRTTCSVRRTQRSLRYTVTENESPSEGFAFSWTHLAKSTSSFCSSQNRAGTGPAHSDDDQGVTLSGAQRRKN